MKVLMAPSNIAQQPMLLKRGLAEHGIDCTVVQYITTPKGAFHHKFGFEMDRLEVVQAANRTRRQMEVLREFLEDGTDVFVFWLRSLVSTPGPPGFLDAGLDIPFIKARGKRVIYRFTGFDARFKSEYMEKTPYNAYRYGYTNWLDEEVQRRYLDFLRQYCDRFVVSAIDIHDYIPDSVIIPRTIDMDKFPYVGVERTDRPLVVHIPSDPAIKGTQFVERSCRELQQEGLKFDYEITRNIPHPEVIEWFKRADIIIDQLCLGDHGVATVEGMALGKPVMVYIREDLMPRFDPPMPIINVNPDTLTEELRALVKDAEKRREYGERGREYALRVHSLESASKQWADLLYEVCGSPPVVPTTTADLDWFLLQRELTKGTMQTVRNVAKGGIRYAAREFLMSKLGRK